MATPKFNRIAQEFMQRIGDPVTLNAGVVQAGKIITSTAEIEAYVNKALHKIFNKYWKAVQGDKQAFVRIFPELISLPADITLVSGNYTIANPHLHFFKLFSCNVTTYYCKIWDESFYSIAKTGVHPDFVATATQPAVIQLHNMLVFFPLNSAYTPTITYIMLPIEPTTGAFLTSGGTTDSPYFDQWNSEIAEIAEALYWTNQQSLEK